MSADRVHEITPMDRFENAIREVGVVTACEWFGYRPDSEFTKETVRVLAERAALSAAEPKTIGQQVADEISPKRSAFQELRARQKARDAK